MKKTTTFCICTLLFLLSNISFAQIGIGTTSPKGILDIDSPIYGVVYPSVALTATNVAAPVINPNPLAVGGALVVGTTIYNTNSTNTGANDVEPGIYSWDGNQWVIHFFKRQSEIYKQTSSQRVSSNVGFEDINGIGVTNGLSFTALYSGLYKIELKVNYGGGDMIDNGDMNTAMATGDFRFIFDSTTHTLNVKSFSTYNDHIGGISGCPCSEANANNAFENGFTYTAGSPYTVANDVTVNADEDFELQQITYESFHNVGETIASVDINYYDDAGGLPGALIGSEAGVVPTSQAVIGNNFGFDVSSIVLDIAPVAMPGQAGVATTYWVEFIGTSSAGGALYWNVSSAGANGNATAQSNAGAFAIPAPTLDGVYIWDGDCTPIGGTNYSNIWVETFKTIYLNLVQGQSYSFSLEFDQATAMGFVSSGNSGDGRGYIGEGIPSYVEFTYIEE